MNKKRKINSKLAVFTMIPAISLFAFAPGLAFAGTSESNSNISVYVASNSNQSYGDTADAVSTYAQKAVKTADAMNKKINSANSSNAAPLAYTDGSSTQSANASFASNYSLGVTGTVNPQTGQLQLAVDNINLPGPQANISAVNLGISNNAPTSDGNIYGFPAGWAPDIPYILPAETSSGTTQQTIYMGAGQSYIISMGYTSADGFQSNLLYLPGRSCQFEAVAPTNKTFTYPNTSNTETISYSYTLTTSQGDIFYFDQGGKLEAQSDNWGNSIVYTYTADPSQQAPINQLTPTQCQLHTIVGFYGPPQQVGYTYVNNSTTNTVTVSLPDGKNVIYDFPTTNNQSQQILNITSPQGRTTSVTQNFIADTAQSGQMVPSTTVIANPNGGSVTYTYGYNQINGGIMFNEEEGDVLTNYYFPAVAQIVTTPGFNQPPITQTYNYNPTAYTLQNGTVVPVSNNAHSFTGGGSVGGIVNSYSSLADNLMQALGDSAQNYTYATAITTQGTDSTNTVTTTTMYNFLHLPTLSVTTTPSSTQSGLEGAASTPNVVNYAVTQYQGDSSGSWGNYNNLASNYNLPTQVTTTTYDNSQVSTKQVTTQFNVYGQPLNVNTYDSLNGSPVNVCNVNYSYYTPSSSITMAPYSGLFNTQITTYTTNINQAEESLTAGNSAQSLNTPIGTTSTVTIQNAQVPTEIGTTGNYYSPTATKTVQSGSLSATAGASSESTMTTSVQYNNNGLPTSQTQTLGGAALTATEGNTTPTSATTTSTYTYGSQTVNGVTTPTLTTTATNPIGLTSSETIDLFNGWILSETDTSGNTTNYTYSDNGLTVTMSIPGTTGTITQNNSANPNEVTITNSLTDSSETIISDGLGRKLSDTVTDANGISSTTSYAYNALGKPETETLPNGRTVSYQYETWTGQATSETDELGNTQSISYNYAANTSSTSLSSPEPSSSGALLGTFATAPTAMGNVIQKLNLCQTTPVYNIALNSTQYDDQGNTLSTQSYVGTTVQNGYYNGINQMVSNNLNPTTSQLADANSTPLISSSYTYDITGKPAAYSISTADGGNGHSTWTRNLYGDIETRTTTFTSVPSDMILSTAALPSEIKTYNAAGQATQIQNPQGQIESYTYDSAGQIKTMTDFSGETYTYNYEMLGGKEILQNEQLPDGSTIAYTYITTPGETYGEVQTVIQKTSTQTLSETTYSYSYSENSNGVWQNTVTTTETDGVNGKSASMTQVYDFVNSQWLLDNYTDFAGANFQYTYYNQPDLPQSDVKSVTQTYNGNTIASENIYYYNGEANGAMYADGSTPSGIMYTTYTNGNPNYIYIAYTYQNVGASTANLKGSPAPAPTPQQLPAPKLQSITVTNPTGSIITMSYYQYDVQGNETGIGTYSQLPDSAGNDNYKVYTYDDLGHLASADVYSVIYNPQTTTEPADLLQGTTEYSSDQYTYDCNNNVLTNIHTDYTTTPQTTVTTNYFYNSLNQLQTVETSAGTIYTPSYNSAGDMIGLSYTPSAGGLSGSPYYQSFTFNPENQLTEFQQYPTAVYTSGETPVIDYSYTYWSDGERMSKTNNQYNS